MNARSSASIRSILIGLWLLLASAFAAAADAPKLTAQEQARLDESDRLVKQISSLSAKGSFRDAIPLARQALTIRQEILGQKNAITANSLMWMGYLLQNVGDYSARGYFEQAVAIRKEVLGQKHPDTAAALNDLGVLLRELGDFTAARTSLEEALAINKQIHGPKHPETVKALNNLALVLQDTGDLTAARPYLEQALAVNREVLGEKHPNTAGAFNNLGNLLRELGDHAAARQHIEQALVICREIFGNRHLNTAIAINSLGFLFQEMGDYAAARSCYEESLAIRQALLGSKHPAVAAGIDNLGSLLRQTGDYKTARQYAEQALGIHKEVFGEKHPNTAKSLTSLGLLLQAMNDYPAAKAYFEQALAIRQEILGDKHPDTAQSLNNMGFVLDAMNDYAAARVYYERALEIYSRVRGDKHRDTALALNNLGMVLCDLGDYEAARPNLIESVTIRQQLLGEGHPDTALSYGCLAWLEAAEGHWDQSIAADERARRITRRHVARVLPGLDAREQLVFLRRTDSGPWHAGLSLGLRCPTGTSAALSAGWLLNGKAVSQETLAQSTLLARDAKNSSSADDVQRLLVVRRRLANLTMSVPKPGQEAARSAEMAKLEEEESTLSRRFVQADNHTIQAEPWTDVDAVRQKLESNEVLVEIARFEVFKFGAKGADEKWQPAHYAAWIIPPAGKGDVKIVDLGPADAIEQVADSARRTLMHPSGSAQRGLTVEQNDAATQTAFREAPAKLAGLVLYPILDQVGAAKRLIISPDAALWLIPWGALPLADGHYAIQEYRIQYVISGRDLVRPEGPATSTSKSTIMADPDYDLSPSGAALAMQAVFKETRHGATDRLAQRAVSGDRGTIGHAKRLPGTSKEANVIAPKLADYVGGESPTLYLDRYAQEGIFKALVSPKVLVMSTHGFFLTDQQVKPDDRAALLASTDTRAAVLAVNDKPLENPLLRCGLLLAGCNQRLDGNNDPTSDADDGILTGMEIVGTDLRGTDLVVLSACETGLGEVHNGEGVAGLRQAFQLAGAEAVIASLWQVPDEQTAELMGMLFENLARKQSKADALRNAQLEMIRNHEKDDGSLPYYWAAFTLTGP